MKDAPKLRGLFFDACFYNLPELMDLIQDRVEELENPEPEDEFSIFDLLPWGDA